MFYNGRVVVMGMKLHAASRKQSMVLGLIHFLLHSGLDWHKIKTLGIVLSCVVKVIPLPVFLETMTIQCGIGQLLF